MTKIMDTGTFKIIPRSDLLVMKYVSKLYRKSKDTFYVRKLFFFLNLAVCEIMWENVVEHGRPQMTLWRVHIACWLPKATNTHTQIV